jgi:hypothetical protein
VHADEPAAPLFQKAAAAPAVKRQIYAFALQDIINK